MIRSKELSPLELMEETLKRIDEVNPELNAFVTLRADEALVEAKSLAGRISSGEDPGPLAGIPIGVKDLEDVKRMATRSRSCGPWPLPIPLTCLAIPRQRSGWG